jgi:uncharacterized protein YchJ
VTKKNNYLKNFIVKNVDQFLVTTHPHHGHNLTTNNFFKKKLLKKFITKNVNFVTTNPHPGCNSMTNNRKKIEKNSSWKSDEINPHPNHSLRTNNWRQINQFIMKIID